MGRFVLRRVIQMVPLIIGITIITFALANLVPGSPVSDIEFNPNVRPEDIQRIEHSLGLDQPVYVRYFQWVSNVVRGDLGLSLVTYRPVTQTVLEKLPNTLELTIAALLLSLVFSIPVGVYAAVRRNSWFDQVSTIGAVAGFAMPTFWLGILVVLLLVKLNGAGIHWPLGGVCPIGNCTPSTRLQSLIAPAFVLAFVQTAAWTRYIRSQMIEVLRQDYMRTAEAKGLLARVVVMRHGLRNAVLPLVTLLALDLPSLFGGAVVTETIFTWNGVGRLIIDSVNKRDYTMIMGTTLMIAVLTVVANLVADIVYGIIDPRIRYD